MKSYVFKVAIEPDKFEDGRDAWHASCPALKGCHTWGHSYEEALANIVSFRQACMNSAEAVGIVGCLLHVGRRMADENQDLETWFKKQFAERKVEPNSGLGGAILYMQKYWDRLTLFLRQAGAPLDNNIVERTLKMAILHRKNARFYKTQNGAHVGDLFMSLIYTCQLCGANPFDYLTELQRHRRELFRNSPDWMPWNYRNALEPGVASSAASS